MVTQCLYWYPLTIRKSAWSNEAEYLRKAEISCCGTEIRNVMSEFSEFAWGIPDVKRDLSYPSSTDEESPATAVATFKALILERPDIGNIRNFCRLS